MYVIIGLLVFIAVMMYLMFKHTDKESDTLAYQVKHVSIAYDKFISAFCDSIGITRLMKWLNKKVSGKIADQEEKNNGKL